MGKTVLLIVETVVTNVSCSRRIAGLVPLRLLPFRLHVLPFRLLIMN